MPSSLSDSDPFVDPYLTANEGEYVEGATLPVGRDASLTLATDALIVLDGDFPNRETGNCCGLIDSRAKTTQAIPLFNILWAELSEFDVSIQYAKPSSGNHVRVTTINYLVEKPKQKYAQQWIARLLEKSYGASERQKRIKVLINPFGGKGSAQKWFLRDIDPIFAAARCQINVEKTMHHKHAVEIAEKLDTDAYDVVACCSGDGLPHEVFNGLGSRKDAIDALSKVAVVQLPCGTGNAMSWNLNGTDSTSLAALCVVKGIRTPLDLVSITQSERRILSFLSQSVGMVAEVDCGTDNLRWMGSLRFTWGFFVRLMKKTVWPCEVAVKIDIPTKAEIKDHYLNEFTNNAPIEARRGPHNFKSLSDPITTSPEDDSTSTPSTSTTAIPPTSGLPSLNFGTIQSPAPTSFTSIPGSKMGNFYAGNMALMAPGANFFPATLPSDGYLDLVTIDGNVSRFAAMQIFLAVESGRFFDMPHVHYRKVSGYRITPKDQPQGGYISIDGERVPFEEFQAEVHKGLGTVLSRSGHMYEAEGVLPRTKKNSGVKPGRPSMAAVGERAMARS